MTTSPLTIYVPSNPTPSLLFLPHAAIVGTGEADAAGSVVVYLESNAFGASNLKRYAERLRSAVGRLVTHYPTSALLSVPAADLIPVGTYSPADHTFSITNGPALDRWLGGTEPSIVREITDDEFDEIFGEIRAPGGDYFTRDTIAPFLTDHFRRVWSVVEGDGGGLYLSPGVAVVNQLGFLVTEREWESGTECVAYYVPDEDELEDEDDEG